MTTLNNLDVSDCFIPGSGGTHSLTSVNLTGCTSLQQLRLDDSDFSAGIPDMSGLTNLIYFDMDQCEISGEVVIPAELTALSGFDLSGNAITSITLPEALLSNVQLYDNSLTEEAVDNVLLWLDDSGVEGGYVDITGEGNSAPSSAGRAAKANLEGKGWDVNVNSAPGGRVGIAASTDFDIVGNFTIEMFVNMSNLSGFPRPYSFGAYPAPNAISIENGTLYFWGNQSARVSGNFSPVIGDWYHICVMRSGDQLGLYVNGTRIANTTYAADIPSGGLPLTIGYGNEANSDFNGLMSNFRWTTSAEYSTSGFTAPTAPLSAVPMNTKLLIFQGNDLASQLLDNSGNGHNATNSGATFNTADPANSAAGSLQMGIV